MKKLILTLALLFATILPQNAAGGQLTNPFLGTNPFDVGGSGGGGGGSGITLYFPTSAERDAYFLLNPDELVEGVTITMGNPASVWVWAGGDWITAAPAYIGQKGDTGATGAQGIQGVPGTDGVVATVTVGTVNTLPPGSPATVENIGDEHDAVLMFGIPQGMPGVDGGGSFGVTSWNGQTGAVAFVESDPVYSADKSGTMQLGDVEIAGSLTLGQPPLAPAEATNKAYVDSAIGGVSQDLLDFESTVYTKTQVDGIIGNIPDEVTYTTETTIYQQNATIPHVQAPVGDLPLATMQEIVLHAQNDQGYWNFLQNVANQVTANQALNTQLQIKVNSLAARVAVLENLPEPEPDPVYDMSSGLTLHTPALLGLLGIEIGGVDLIGSGWEVPGDGILVVDGAATIGLLTPVWIAVNDVKADPSGSVLLQILADGQNGQIVVHEGDIVTQSGMGNITYYKQLN